MFVKHIIRKYSSSQLYSQILTFKPKKYVHQFRCIDVTRRNFDIEFQNFEQLCSKCSFISYDAEFSGTESSVVNRIQSGDTIFDRYTKLSVGVRKFVPLEIGFTLWTEKENKNWIAQPFNFCLFPRSNQKGKTFQVETDAIEFLVRNNFDFNKCIREGISFEEEKENIVNNPVPHQHIDIEFVQYTVEKIKEWYSTANLGDELELRSKDLLTKRVLQQELPKYFSNGITFYFSDKFLKIEKSNQERFKKQSRGFIDLVKLILDSKKLLIGHNMWLDIMFLLNHFVKPLPYEFQEFKQQFNQTFSRIADTKHIALNTSRITSSLNETNANLRNLFHFVCGDTSWIEFPKEFGTQQNGKFHSAGYDSFITGALFIQLLKLNYGAEHISDICNGNDTSVSKTFKNEFENKVHVYRSRKTLVL